MAVVLVLLLAGCVAGLYQRSALADFQTVADRVTQAYGVAPLTVVVGRPAVAGAKAGADAHRRVIVLAPEVLEPQSQGVTYDFVVAHEIAHVVLGHVGQQPQQELDANAEAVKILVIGRGWTERRAFDHASNALWNGMQNGRGRPRAAGHLSWCAELADLTARYPAYPGKGC